jgi:polyphosphate glucokinase
MAIAPRTASGPRTLTIDVGGSGLKAAVLDARGAMLVERVRVPTPVGRPPALVIEALARLVAPLPAYDRISVGFPGVVRDGKVLTAPNLGHRAWASFDLARALRRRLGKPTRIANDADLQGLAVVKGRGVELVVTLGTGFGTGSTGTDVWRPISRWRTTPSARGRRTRNNSATLPGSGSGIRSGPAVSSAAGWPRCWGTRR